MNIITLEKVPCNLCGSHNAQTLFNLLDVTTMIEQQFPIVRCRTCGLVYLNPRPVPGEISKFYPDDFVSYQFEVSDFNSNVHIKNKMVSLITKSMIINRIKSVSKRMRLNCSTRVLDVGCGKGSFLFYLRKMYNCEVQGLDFNEKCLQFCKEKLNIDVSWGDIKSNEEYLRTPFNLITMWAFLEHDFDPFSSLINARKHLTDDGLLVVEVPNERSLENIFFGKRSFLFDAPRHLYNFSFATLKSLLSKAGFTVLDTIYPVGAGGWLGTFQRLLTNDKVYSNLRGHLPFLITMGALIYPLEFFLSFSKFGSVMRVFAKKL